MRFFARLPRQRPDVLQAGGFFSLRPSTDGSFPGRTADGEKDLRLASGLPNGIKIRSEFEVAKYDFRAGSTRTLRY
jgi:hypothetical protein